MQIPQIEPFQFIRSTAFSERVQLANKINEIIDGINSIGEIPDLQAEIDAIKGTISQIQTDITDTDSDVSDLSNQVNTLISEVNGLLKEVISEVALDSPGYGQVRVKLIHEDESETASNALQIPVIQDGGITLISGTTDRSFKIRYVTTDGVTHTTNDFVIPEGGGTDITVTSVSIEQGDTSNSFKFEIGLSDGSSIQSNSYPFPPGTELTPATTSQLGGIKVGTHLSVTSDGTLSVDMTTIGTAAKTDSIMWTADASKVTFHADSLNGSDFTEDIPQASQGGAGTIDAATYAKIASTEAALNALAPSVSVNEEVSPAQITVTINGKSSTANLPSGGSEDEWTEVGLSEIPTDLQLGDSVKLVFGLYLYSNTSFNWDTTTPTTSNFHYGNTDNAVMEKEVTFDESDTKNYTLNVPICVNLENGVIMIAALTTITNLVSWNNGVSPIARVTLTAFNGAGNAREAIDITRSNASTFLYKLYIKRAN